MDAGQSADVDLVVDARPQHAVTSAAAAATWTADAGEPAWNNTPSCVRTQGHVMRHQPSPDARVSFSVDAVVNGDRDGALADRPSVTERRQGVREMLSELLVRSALNGDIVVVFRLVSCRYVHVDVADRTGNTALHCAAVSYAHCNSYSSCPLCPSLCHWDSAFCMTFFVLYRPVWFVITSFPGKGAKYCDQRVCMFVCLFVYPLTYLKNHTSTCHQIFCTY